MDVRVKVGAMRLRVSPRLPPAEFRKIRKKLTYVMHNYRFTTQHINYGWNGEKTLFYKNQTAPTGCLSRLVRIMEEDCGYHVDVEYEHDYKPQGDAEIHGLTLERFQKDAVQRILQHRRGIIEAPVRAGKTAIAASAINKIGHFPVWVITYGKDLVHQTRKALAYHLDCSIGVFSESVYEPGDVVVTSYQAVTRVVSTMQNANMVEKLKATTHSRNLKIMDQIHEAKVFIFDECHHALAPKNSKLLKEIHSAGYVIGLSGTPKPDGIHKLELEATIGAIIFNVKYKTLIKHKRLAEPMITLYQLPYKWYATGLTEFADAYENNIVENLHRNLFIADIAKNLKKQGKTTFIMVRKLAHGPILRALIPGSVFVQGSMPSDQRAQLYAALQAGRIECIIATVGKEGLNIPKLDVVINAEGYKATTTTLQKMRSLTAAEGKRYGIIIDFIDRGKFLGKHSRIRIKLYKKLGNVRMRTKRVPNTYYPVEGTRWLQ